MTSSKAQSTLAAVVDMIAADVDLLQKRVGDASAELSLDDARRITLYADRLEAIVRHERVRPLRDASLGDLIERAKRIPELRDAIRKFEDTTPGVDDGDE